MSPSEDDLCRALANKLVESCEFASWFLNHVGIHEDQLPARLLHQEQIGARPHVDPKNWWRHWHSSKVKKVGPGQETDIFLVFESIKNKERFAFHIENKKRRRLSEKETANFKEQAEAYRPRAEFMAKKREFLCYTHFATGIVAPAAFCIRYKPTCDLFDFPLPYESIASFILDYHVSVLR